MNGEKLMGTYLTVPLVSTSETRGFRGVELSTLSNIAILLLISVLAIIHLKVILQPLVVAILLFFLIRPPAQWLEERYGHPLAAYGILMCSLALVVGPRALRGYHPNPTPQRPGRKMTQPVHDKPASQASTC